MATERQRLANQENARKVSAQASVPKDFITRRMMKEIGAVPAKTVEGDPKPSPAAALPSPLPVVSVQPSSSLAQTVKPEASSDKPTLQLPAAKAIKSPQPAGAVAPAVEAKPAETSAAPAVPVAQTSQAASVVKPAGEARPAELTRGRCCLTS